jgi:hypothetical protein
VVPNGVLLHLADYLFENMPSAVTYLEGLSGRMPPKARTTCHH